MIKRELFQKNDKSVPIVKVLEDIDLKSVSGGVTTEECNESEVNKFEQNESEQSKETVTQESPISSTERLKSLVRQIQGESTTDIRNNFPENVSPRHSPHDLYEKVLEKSSVKNNESESDTGNAITIRMKERIDRLTQDDTPEPQTPNENNGSVYTGIDDYLENASVLKTEGIYDEIDINMDIDAMNEEMIRQVSAPQMVQANQNPLDSLKFITANGELPF